MSMWRLVEIAERFINLPVMLLAEGELLVNRVDLQVFRNGEGLESRLIGVKGEERPYALYRETAQKHAQVFVGRWYLDGVAK